MRRLFGSSQPRKGTSANWTEWALPMDFNRESTLNYVFNVIAECSVENGVKRLIDYCRRTDPSTSLLNRLERIDYVRDARAIKDQLRAILEETRIPKSRTGFYFGLDGLNIPSGKG